MTVPILPDAAGESDLELRQYQAELKSNTVDLDLGLSLDRRPDAISLDYLTAFTLGPVNIGDFSLGAQERVWKIRAQGGTVFSARQKNDRSDFEGEVLLFSHSADTPTEIDAAFDQNARVLVCMESPSGPGRQGELLIYYYDPFSASYQLVNFGRGRTPRAVLDDVVDTNNGDLLVFYVHDLKGICYRQQRDRYLVEYIVPNSLPVIVPVGTPIANTCVHGPVVFNYTGDPTVVTGNLDGIAVEARAPLDTVNGVVLTYFTPFRGWAHSNQPGVFRPMNNFNDYYSFTGNVPDPDGWRIQSAPIAVDYGLSQLVTGFNRNIQSTDVVLTFTPAVAGIEIEGIQTLDYDNRIIAYDALGNVLASIEPTPPFPFAARTGPYAIYAAGIKTVRLVSAIGQVYNNGLSWSRLRFKKTGDPLAIPTLVTAPLPIPPDVVLIAPPLPPIQNLYLEDAYRSTDNRVHVLYSARDPLTGTYTLGTKSTILYPFFLPMEAIRMGQPAPVSGTNKKIILYALRPGTVDPEGFAPDAYTQIDEFKMGAPLPSGFLVDTVVYHTLYDKDEFKMGAPQPQSGSVPVVLLFHTLYDIDKFQMLAPIPASGVLIIAMILHTLYDKDEFKMIPPVPLASSTLV